MGARVNPAVRSRGALEALVSLADEVRGLPFVWGATDCGALFLRALACIDEEGGRHLEVLTWADGWGALKALQRMTPALLMAEIGATVIDIRDATAGDLVLGWTMHGDDAPPIGWPTCHVGVGSLFLSSSQATGVVLLPRSMLVEHPDTLTVWRVT